MKVSPPLKDPDAVVAIIPSGGSGKRMGGKKKNLLPLLGKPVLYYTLKPFEASPLVQSVILVVPAEDVLSYREDIVKRFRFKKVADVIAGGKERQDSVFNGVKAIGRPCALLLIHDGARPLVTADIIERTIKEAYLSGAAITAMPVKDTIKEANGKTVIKTLQRERLWSVQTPQAFRPEILLPAFKKAQKDGFTGTDESSIVERLGVSVKIVEGSYENIKITTPEDMALATAILKCRASKDGAG